jgi:hypothetical protein
MAKEWHGFGMFGQGGRATDPWEDTFSARVHALGVNIHGSPYGHYDVPTIVGLIDRLPPESGIFVWGTSLGACNAPLVCDYTKRQIDGAFGFQASIYGYHGSVPANVKFAHLIYSYNPLPLPGLGAYIWQNGGIHPASLHLTPHHIPHPGDYDVGDQDMFLNEIKRIMNHGDAT